jgi:hypothetical protein
MLKMEAEVALRKLVQLAKVYELANRRLSHDRSHSRNLTVPPVSSGRTW